MDANEMKNEVNETVDRWFGALFLTVSPMISPAAYSAIDEARANLKRQLAAVFGSPSNGEND